LVEIGRSIQANGPKACNFFEVTHSTWSSLGRLRSVGVLTTLIIDFEMKRSNSMEGGELRTFLSLEDCVDRHIIA
jgi:hypothetical protein